MKKVQKSSFLKKSVVATLAIPALTPFGFAQDGDGLPALASLGPLDFNASLFVRSFYDDNIFLAPADARKGDVITSVTPAIKVRYGGIGHAYSQLDYMPTFQFFKRDGNQDAINHDARFRIEKTFTRLTVGFSQSFSRVTDSSLGFNQFLGQRLEQDTYITRLLSKYDFSDKTSFEVNGGLNAYDYPLDSLTSYKEFSNDNWLNYKAAQKITTSAGVTLGYADLSGGLPSQTYERGLLRVTYVAAEKLQFRTTGGVEVRQVGGGKSDQVLPVFSIGATYKPRESTTISLDASRARNIAIQNRGQNSTSTGLTAQVRQEILRKLSVYFGGDFYATDYTGSTRSDSYYSLKYGVDYKVTRRVTVGAFHMYRDNAASGKDNADNPINSTFRNHQFGLQASAEF